MARQIAPGEGPNEAPLFGFGLIEQAAEQGIQARTAVSAKVGVEGEAPPDGNGNGIA